MSHFINQKWDKTIESVIYTVIWKGIVVGVVNRTANIDFSYPNFLLIQTMRFLELAKGVRIIKV